MRLLPHDEKFFDLILDQGKIVLEASRAFSAALNESAGPPDTHALAAQVRASERKADEQLRQIYRRLHKTFITPIDPEDVHALATRIDEIVDHLDAAAYRIEAYGLERSLGRIPEIARMVHGCVESTVKALDILKQNGVEKSDDLSSLCEEINQRELETENRVREIVRDLFASERDPIALMKLKDVYELLESTADCCENVADVLEAIAVKNS
jgi:uncharacterized protein Yka (UPF0111/DUF47 family)